MGQQGKGKDLLTNHSELEDESLVERMGEKTAEGNRTLIL